ncbi:MAG: phosphatase PAP2 family protein [archaeon]|nr:phosphatase PAP2 family protein [archaeon]
MIKEYQHFIFNIAVLASCCFPFALLIFHNLLVLAGITISIVTVTVVLLIEVILKEDQWKAREILKIILIFLLLFHLVPYFLITGKINVQRDQYDKVFFAADNFLLGWLWPYGQLGLELDQSPRLNSTTIAGKTINSIFLFFYMSYYFVPIACILGHPLYMLINELLYLWENKGNISDTYKQSWNNFYFIASTFILTYIPVLVLNTIFPAISPRIYIDHLYTHELKFFFPFSLIPHNDNESANSFPSGHVAESVCFFLTLHVIGYNKLKYVPLIFGTMIAWSTLILRKHYFVDILVGGLIALGAFLLPYFLGYKMDLKQTEEIPAEEEEVEKFSDLDEKDIKDLNNEFADNISKVSTKSKEDLV